MKTALYFLPLLLLVACGDTPTAPAPTVQELVKQKIEDYALPQFNDPGSYEFVSITEGGAVTIEDNINYRRRDAAGDLGKGNNDLQRAKEMEEILGKGSKVADIERARNTIARAEAMQLAIDSLQASFKAAGTFQDTVSTMWLWKYRANNAMGAKILGEQMVQMGPAPDFVIHKMTDERGKLLLTPGGIPGWTDVITVILEDYPY